MKPVTLEDDAVALYPMSHSQQQELHQAGMHESIWQWTTESYCLTSSSTEQWINACLERQEQGSQLAFSIFDKHRNQIVGSTSYLNINLPHGAIEIGYTFLTPAVQRSSVNRRCKLLLLRYAFEQLQVNRVAFQTHEKNHISRTAILGIGAQFEGVLRDCRIQQDGSIRSSAVFSIIKSEWPAVQANLQAKIQA